MTDLPELTIDEFIKKAYPPPPEGHKDRAFYDSWGYEQWLIKSQKHDLEQLRIIEAANFNHYKLARALEGEGIIEYMVGKSIVRAKRVLDGFLMTPCCKGGYGVRLWEDDAGHFCFMASGVRTIFKPLMRYFSDDDVEITDLVFESSEQVDELCADAVGKVCYPAHLKGHHVELPNGREIVYVFNAHSHGYGHTSATLHAAPSVRRKDDKGWKKPLKKDQKDIRLEPEEWEDVRIVQW